jgi:hypothetical protein
MSEFTDKFKIKTHVTKAMLKMTIGEPVYVKIISPIVASTYKGKVQLDEKGEARKPAEVCDVIDLQGDADTPLTLIANKVMQSELDNNYPNNKYVGKRFKITKGPKPTGKAYNTFAIAELE